MLPDHPGAGTADAPDDGIDEIIDLTDRRRMLLRAVFGVTVPAETADSVFEGGPGSNRD